MILSGTILVALVLLFVLGLRLRRRPIVVSVMVVRDQDGRLIGRHRVRPREPDHLSEDGLAQLKPYVERLIASRAWSASLWIHLPEGGHGVCLSKTDCNVYFHFIIRWRQTGEREAKVREIFDALDLEPRTDYLSGDGDLRLLSWWAESDAERLVEIGTNVLRAAYDVADEDAFDVTYTEERRRPRHANPFGLLVWAARL